ncbi:MAG: hypothetical protein HYV09_14305 [Deltaproteobacteria bacterium]|nr:hypothetical protein [Deltaproteobacteria bacterium]
MRAHNLGIVSLLVCLGCSNKESRPAGVTYAGDSAAPIWETSAPPEDSATVVPPVDADVPGDSAAAPVDTGGVTFPDADFGPVPDAVVGEGAVVEPPPSYGPLTFCTRDIDKLSTKALLAGGTTPKAFADAWNAEAGKLAAGVLLLELRGLKSDPPNHTLAIGTTNGATPPAFLAPGPATTSVSIDDKTRLVSASTESSSFQVVFGSTAITVGRFSVRGSLDGKCEAMADVKVTLWIPQTAKDVAFAGSTVGALLGPPNDVILAEDAWRIELVGAAAHAGGS